MKVLVVEEETELIRQLGRLFHRAQVRMECASTEEDAHRLAASRGYDCLVVSTRVAHFSGLHLLYDLRREGDETPVVMLVPGSDSADRRFECLDMGADDCLSLPLSPQELLLRVQAVIRRSSRGFSGQSFAMGN